MMHSNKNRFKLVVYLFMMRVVTNNSHDTETRAENILSKLEASVRQQEEYGKSLEAQQYTMLRFKGKNMRFENVYREWQSIFGESNQDEMISIITLRNLYPDEARDEEEYMIKFAKALQEQVRGNEDHILFDSLFVSVNSIRRSHIEDFDHLYDITGEIYNRFKVFNIMIIENFYEMCLDAFMDIFCDKIKRILYSCGNFSGLVDEKCEDNYVNYAKTVFSELLEDLGKKNREVFNLAFDHKGDCSILETLNAKLYYFKQKKQSESLQSSKFYRKFYDCITIVKHRELFKMGTKDLFSDYFELLKLEESKCLFDKHFTRICDALIEYLKEDISYEYDEFDTNIYSFCLHDEVFLNEISSFLRNKPFENIGDAHKEKFKPVTDVIRQTICAENVTKIALRGKLTSDQIIRLCNIVKNKRIFETECKHQIIFIDDEKAITKEDAEIASAKFDLIDFDVSVGVKAIELFALTATAENVTNEGAKFVNIEYRRDVSENKEAGQIICNDEFADFNKMSLTVSRSTSKISQSKEVCELLKMCLEKNNSNFVEICTVSLKVK